jgi:hypothetical protein
VVFQLPIDTKKFITNEEYLEFRRLVRLALKNSETVPEAWRIPLKSGAIDSSVAKLVEGVRVICDFWYTENVGEVADEEILARYGTLQEKVHAEMKRIRSELPAFIEAILRPEDKIKDLALEEMSSKIGIMSQVGFIAQAYIAWFEGAIYWLCLIRKDLESLKP